MAVPGVAHGRQKRHGNQHIYKRALIQIDLGLVDNSVLRLFPGLFRGAQGRQALFRRAVAYKQEN